ncbi:carboxypeptidase-like regulatory domain-containing protein [Pontiellaceae bacterium B12219]|nr:carboxypeptidase-like regulatory domain-containing protein [Pontiellaceae bacterium B12219]
MKMSKNKILGLVTCISLLASMSHSEDLVITSFDKDGTLEWSSDYTNGSYQIQWASNLDGEWHTNFPYSNIQNTNEIMSVQVPRFFRVVWKEGYSIEGIVYYSTSVLTNETVRLDPWSDGASPEQSTITDLSGKFRFDGVKNGEYVIWTTSHDGFNGVGRFINVDDSNLTQDLRAYKRVSYLSPVRDSVITTNVVTFTWETVAEASLHTFWLRTGNDDNYGSKFLTIPDLGTNAYQASLTLTNGLYSWGVDLYDSEGNKVAFGNDFDFVYSIEQ